MRRGAVLAICVVATVAACSDEPEKEAGGQPDRGALEESLVASCGGVEFEGLPADPSEFPPADAVWDETNRDEIGMEADFFDLYDWSIAAQSAEELHLFGSPIGPLPDEGSEYAAASFEREGEVWSAHSWGQCRIELTAPGFGPARFVLDPAHEPDPEASSISVQATELACTGGRAPVGRDVVSVVLAEDERSVSVVVLVEPPSGAQTCPGNPSFPLEIALGSPVGDREVLDAGTQPPLVRPWPPTQSSLESMGLEE